MAAFDFNPEKPSPQDIKRYYEECKAGIEAKFDPGRNPNYQVQFALMSAAEIDNSKTKLLDELSLRSSFCLLAYIESLFRTDFILRVRNHNKGKNDILTKIYKDIFNPAKPLYTYSLVDVIFNSWKQFVEETADETADSAAMLTILRTLPQYYDFRNWIAHGRYWVFKERNYNRKYNYTQIQILLGSILQYFSPFLKRE